MISQNHSLDMQTVLSRSLGPIRWALAASDGTIRKTNKPTNGDVVEKPVLLVDGISVNSACIIGGMSIVQKLKGNIQHLISGKY